MERIQKIIANSGYCSRRKAEELIKAGKVKLNGEVIRELGTKANYSDQIMVDNHLISEENKVYYLLNKPRSIITSVSDDKKRKTVVDLINTDKRIYPVGRLDYDTTGILILTNDGELANLIMHPKNKIDKVYIAKVKGLVNKEIAMKLSNGVFVDGKKTSKAHVKVKKYDKKRLRIFSIISLILMLICYVIWCLMQHIKYIMFTPILVLLIFIRYDKEAKKSLDGNLVDVLLNDKILTLICILYGIIIISLLELYL